MRMGGMLKKFVVAACAIAGASGVAGAETNWPQRNVRLVVAFAPAGPADIVARLLAQQLQQKWGQTVLVENRAGGGGNVGAQVVSRSDPDGYTVLVSTSAFSVNLTLYDKPGYALSDFHTAAVATSSPNILVASLNLKQNTLREFIDAAKTEKLSFGSAGIGTTPHLTGELIFRIMNKVDVRHVPFTGAAPAVTATMGGQVPLAWVALPGAFEQVRSKTVKGVAIATAKRIPELPTVNESGLGDLEAVSVVAFYMPSKTPMDVVEKFNADVNAIIRSGVLDKGFAAAGAFPMQLNQKEADAFVANEAKRWGDVVRAAGVKAE
jgi:tripartite-type tricarboxylate transporter receptor subunit TctC